MYHSKCQSLNRLIARGLNVAKSGKFVWNPAGYRDANNSAEVMAEVDRVTQAIKTRANAMLPPDAAPFEADTQEGKTLAHGLVKTSSDKGREGFRNRQAQARHNILLKAAGS